jgi:hypothetical protein
MEHFVATLRRSAPGALLAAALAVTAAACGASGSTTPSSGASTAASLSPQAVSDPLASWSAERIVRQSQTDTLAAPYVRVTGNVSSSGQQIAFDLTMVAGTGCKGSVTEHGIGSFTLVSLGKSVWVLPDAQFYKSEVGQNPNAQLAETLLAGKYLEDTEGTGLGSLATLCSLKSMLGSTSQSSSDDAGTTKAGTAMIDGQRALKLVNAKQHGTAYVSDTTKPEVLQIAVSGSGGGSLSFTYYTTAPAITPPPASQTIDGSKYGF